MTNIDALYGVGKKFGEQKSTKTGLLSYVSELTGNSEKSRHAKKFGTAISNVQQYFTLRSTAIDKVDENVATKIEQYGKKLAEKIDITESEKKELIDKKIKEYYASEMEDFYLEYPEEIYNEVKKYTKLNKK